MGRQAACSATRCWQLECSTLRAPRRLQGQTQGKARARHTADYDEPGSGGHSYGRGSPPVPGSPLTYSPQVPMEPIPKGEEYGRGGSVYGQSEFAG